jgi:hypothetical protein
MKIRVVAGALALCAGSAIALGDDASAGPNGINSRGLGVNGAGVYIGQVEGNYVGLAGTDKPGEWFWDYGPDGLPATGDAGEGDGVRLPAEAWVENSGDGAYESDWRNAHPHVVPVVQLNLNAAPGSAAPFLTGAIPPGPWNRLATDPNTAHHAIRVGGVMNSFGATNKGVAAGSLHVSVAYNNGVTSDPVLATQAVATARPVRVINHSYGFQNPAGPYDGNSQITMGMDWVASRYNVLNVVAGDQTSGPNPGNPSDNYNGVNVATSRVDGTGQFNPVDASNVFTPAAGGRNVVSFIAPGKGINVPLGATGRGTRRASTIACSGPRSSTPATSTRTTARARSRRATCWAWSAR